MSEDSFYHFRSLFGDNDFFAPKSHDWEELKKRGRVEEYSKEENGFITVTRTFTSFDGKEKITESDTTHTFDAQILRLMDIENEIKEALIIEDYEKCAKLKKEKDSLKVNIRL